MKLILKITTTAVLSGVLLALTVPPFGWYFLVFLAFIPVFHLFKVGGSKITKLKSALAIFLTYTTWQLIEYFWLFDEYPGTYLIGSFANALCFSLPFFFLPIALRKLNSTWALAFGFISAISVGEWISQSTELTSPFCNIGLILGQEPGLIQHYRWIGVEGAALWIVGINVLLYLLFTKIVSEKSLSLAIRPALMLLCFLSLPLLAQLKTADDEIGAKEISVAVLKTDVDHYSDFFMNHPERMIDTLFAMSDKVLQKNPDLLIWPEVIVNPIGWLHQIDSEEGIIQLKERLESHQKTHIVFGASAFSLATKDDIYASEANGYYFNTHNLSLVVGAKGKTRYKSKDKFIALQERMPFLEVFPSLKDAARSWEISTQFSPVRVGSTTMNFQNGFTFESALCYESLFSLYMMQKAEADLIVVHASEKWMNNELGSIQYHYSTCPIAIQLGRPIVRSTNAGIASVISASGYSLQQTKGKKGAETLFQRIKIQEGSTVYGSLSGMFYGLSTLYTCVIIIISLLKSTNHV